MLELWCGKHLFEGCTCNNILRHGNERHNTDNLPRHKMNSCLQIHSLQKQRRNTYTSLVSVYTKRIYRRFIKSLYYIHIQCTRDSVVK